MKANKLVSVLKLLAIYLIMGVFCGIVGAVFSKGVQLVTGARLDNPWLLYLLPAAGILTAAIYKLLKVSGMGTDQVLNEADGKAALSAKLAPAIFFASLLSHLCGASVGKEGAALQLGGSSALFFSRKFKLSKEQEKTLVYCGMAGVFSSAFGTPLAAAAFALEVVLAGRICFAAALPTLITSVVSYFTAVLLGAHAERFTVSAVPTLSLSVVWKVLILALAAAAIGVVFCLSLKYLKLLFKKLFKNEFLRIFVGAVAIVLLTFIVGTRDYNGAGIEIMERIFNDGEFAPWAFALKLLFTCIAVAAGFKGGEIVPTLFIGATLGAVVGTFLGLPVAFSAAVCMVCLFCSATNCPLASILLAAELFSCRGIGYVCIAVAVSYCISGKISLYATQKTAGLKSLF
ncbi:MAG: chloride channel protein [Oscillospiraceae bacterium]|nr:chloride channel protein [Oscillospiraceae bacterium]